MASHRPRRDERAALGGGLGDLDLSPPMVKRPFWEEPCLHSALAFCGRVPAFAGGM